MPHASMLFCSQMGRCFESDQIEGLDEVFTERSREMRVADLNVAPNSQSLLPETCHRSLFDFAADKLACYCCCYCMLLHTQFLGSSMCLDWGCKLEAHRTPSLGRSLTLAPENQAPGVLAHLQRQMANGKAQPWLNRALLISIATSSNSDQDTTTKKVSCVRMLFFLYSLFVSSSLEHVGRQKWLHQGRS